MTFYQRRAQQKASEDRRKGAKQGKAIYDFVVKVREERERKAKEEKEATMDKDGEK